MKSFVTTALLCAACSSGDFKGAGDKKVNGFEPQRFVSLVGFTGAVVKAERRFAGYSEAAQRISLIDPTTESEAWGRQLDGAYALAVPLPDFSAVALYAAETKTLRLVGRDSDRSFPAAPAFSVGFLAQARAVAAYAAASVDGKQFHVVRALGGGRFQEESFASPFASDADLAPLAAPSGDQPPLAVALWSPDGTRLVLLVPADGRYAVYAAADAASPLAGPVRTCAGDGAGTPDHATFRTALWDDGAARFYLGDRTGKISAVLSDADCVAAAARPAVALGTGTPITDVTLLGAGKLAVTQAGGRAHTVAFDGTAFHEPQTLEGLCDYPLGLAQAGAARFAAVCLARPIDDVRAETEAPANVSYSKAYVQVIDAASRKPQREIELPLEGAAGTALDADQGRLLELQDSALGILRVTGLDTGEVRTRKGLFLDGILD